MEKSQETKNIHFAIQKKKLQKKKKVPRNPWSIVGKIISSPEWLKTNEMKKLVDDGMFLQMKIILVICHKRILLLLEQMVAPSQQGGFWLPTIEKTFWFQASGVYLRTFTPRSWRRTIRAYLFLQTQTVAVGIEFVLYMVEMARLLVVFFKFKQSQERGKQKFWEKRRDPFLTVSWRKPKKMAFKSSIYFVTDRSFTADSGLLQRWVQKNTSNDPFSRCATSNNYACSLSSRWQDKVELQHQEENLELRVRGETER